MKWTLSKYTPLAMISRFRMPLLGVIEHLLRLKAPRMVCKIILPPGLLGLIYIPIFVTLASGTIAGLGAYFLGLSSLANSLHDDDPKKRVKKLKDKLQTGSCIHRTPKICSLHNLANSGTCPPDIPPGFRDGDEVDCKDTSSTSANTVVAIPGCFIAT